MRHSLFLLLLAGCPGPATPHDQPDAQVPDGLLPDAPATATTITLDSQGTQFDLVAVKDGIGNWVALPTAGNPYRMQVHGDYVVATVCDLTSEGASPVVQYFGRTLADPTTIFDECIKGEPASFDVTGHMVQPGRLVFVDPDAEVIEDQPTANWPFDFPLSAGTYDAAAISATAIELRRGVAITGAIAVAPFDTAAHGAPLVPTAFSAANTTSDETVTAVAELRTSRGPLFFDRVAPAAVVLAPDSLLEPGDANSVAIEAVTAVSTRSVRRDFHTGDATVFTLPSKLAPATTLPDGAVVVVRLPDSVPPAFDFGDVFLIPSSLTDPGLDFDFSPSFAVAVAGKLVVDQDIPGMLSFWKTDPTQTLNPSLFIQRTVGGDRITQTSQLEPASRASMSGSRTKRDSRRR